MSTRDPFAMVDTLHTSKHATHDVGRESRRNSPRFGWCLRCGMANCDRAMHSIEYDANSGMSPTCETCWRQSTPHERMEYCRALFRSWLVGSLDCAWSSNVTFCEDHPYWQKIRRYLEQSGDGAVIPGRMWTAAGVKKTWRGTWWNPWTWNRGWDVTFQFKMQPQSREPPLMPFFRLTTTDEDVDIYSKGETLRWCSASSYAAGDGHRMAIVRAANASDARTVAATSAMNEGSRAWMDESTTVEDIGAGPPEVLGKL